MMTTTEALAALHHLVPAPHGIDVYYKGGGLYHYPDWERYLIGQGFRPTDEFHVTADGLPDLYRMQRLPTAKLTQWLTWQDHDAYASSCVASSTSTHYIRTVPLHVAESRVYRSWEGVGFTYRQDRCLTPIPLFRPHVPAPHPA